MNLLYDVTCMMLQGENLHPAVAAVQKKLRSEIFRRFVTEEREGHTEDLLIATVLDPRFNDFMFPGSTLKMRTEAERFLKAAYAANWSPEARNAAQEGDAEASVEQVILLLLNYWSIDTD